MCVSVHEEQNHYVEMSSPGFLAHYVVKYWGSSEDEYLIFRSIMRNEIFSNMILYRVIDLERMVFELSITLILVKSQDLDNTK